MIDQLIFDNIRIIYKEDFIFITKIDLNSESQLNPIAIINPEQENTPSVMMEAFEYWKLDNRTRHNVDSAIYYIISKYYE